MAGVGTNDWTSNELRAAPRISLMLRAAKLVCPAGEFLCILRDVSATGLKVRLFHALPAARPLTIELGSGDRYPVDPVWAQDNHAGFRFIGEVDLAGLIDESGRYPKRQLRLKLDQPVIVTAGEVNQTARLGNISQHGAMIETQHKLALSQLVQVQGPGLPARHARVRWRKGAAHGLVFQDGFRLDELALLVAGLQRTAPTTGLPVRINH